MPTATTAYPVTYLPARQSIQVGDESSAGISPVPGRIQDKKWLQIEPSFVTSFDGDRQNLYYQGLIGVELDRPFPNIFQ